jgi:hypothetical protein
MLVPSPELYAKLVSAIILIIKLEFFKSKLIIGMHGLVEGGDSQAYS